MRGMGGGTDKDSGGEGGGGGGAEQEISTWPVTDVRPPLANITVLKMSLLSVADKQLTPNEPARRRRCHSHAPPPTLLHEVYFHRTAHTHT